MQDECMILRKDAEGGEGAAAFHKHMEGCEACKKWHRENQEMLAMVASMPQFDVSEALTQRVMSAVEAQPKRHFAQALLTPVGVIAIGALCTVVPVDSAEGLLSCVVAMIGLFAVSMIVKSAPLEEVAN